jgi:integrase
MSKWRPTDKELAALKPGVGRKGQPCSCLYNLGDCLNVKVSANGKSRIWVYRYTRIDENGKRHDIRLSLGPLKHQSYDEARATAIEWNRRRGPPDYVDPEQERASKKFRRTQDTIHGVTVAKMLSEYMQTLESHTRGYQLKTHKYLRPVAVELGKLPANMVTREMLVQSAGLTVEKLQETPSAWRALRGHLRQAWEMAKFNYGLKENPADFSHPLERRYVKANEPRKALPHEENSRLVAALRSEQWSHRTQAWWLQWLMLTGVRLMEAGEMQWSDIDETWDIWTLQPINQKTGHRAGIIVGADFHVPITAPMKQVLQRMKAVQLEHAARDKRDPSPDDYVFPSPMRHKRGHPMTKEAMTHFRQELQWPIPFDAHGFRATFTMWAEEQVYASGRRLYSIDLIERQVNHKLPKVQEAYRHRNRPGFKDPMFKQRVAMMEKYGAYCASPWPPADNVDYSLRNRKIA